MKAGCLEFPMDISCNVAPVLFILRRFTYIPFFRPISRSPV